MRRLLIIGILCLVSCTTADSNSNSTDTKQLHTLINQWHLDASEANYNDYFNFIADSGIFIGTDITERWTKNEFSEFSKPYFERGKAWSFLTKERTIRIDYETNIAWFDEVLDTWMGDCRATGVLQFIDNEWKLQHYQLSMTIDNDIVADVLKLRDDAAAQD